MNQESLQSFLLVSIIVFGTISALLSTEKILSKCEKLKQMLLIITIVVTAMAGVVNHYISENNRKNEQVKHEEEMQKLQSELKQLISNEFSNLPASLSAKINFSKYLTKYPEGFAIFQLGTYTPILPLYSNLSDNYIIEWISAKITKNTNTEIELQLPNILTKDNSIKITGGITGGKKKVGNLGGYLFNDITIWGEILEINPSNIVFLIGLESNNLNKFDTITKLVTTEIEKIHELYNQKNYNQIWGRYSEFNIALEKNEFYKQLKRYNKEYGEFISTLNIWPTININLLPNVAQLNLVTKFKNKTVYEYFEFKIIDEVPILEKWSLDHEIFNQIDRFHDMYNNREFESIWMESTDKLKKHLSKQAYVKSANFYRTEFGKHRENLLIRPEIKQDSSFERVIINIDAQYDSLKIHEILSFSYTNDLWRLNGFRISKK